MDIYFKTRKLQKECSSENQMVKRYGAKKARKLRQRLMELQAAETLDDISRLPPARCHELAGNRAGQFSVDLAHPYRLLFIPANDPIPEGKGGGIDRSEVTQIEIIEIADTHD